MSGGLGYAPFLKVAVVGLFDNLCVGVKSGGKCCWMFYVTECLDVEVKLRSLKGKFLGVGNIAFATCVMRFARLWLLLWF